MRELVTLFWLIITLSTSAQAWTHGSVASVSNGGMLLGIGPLTYYYNNPIFLNWAQGSGGQEAYKINKISGGTYRNSEAYAGGVIDTNGELVAGAGLSNVLSIAKGIFTA
jgi:hypothetical protein